ncbi:MAG: GntP family permease [Gammaproteobacteria bacterium]|nr:GntP family permease [Gammaproteobacteria bacterium]
MNEVQLIGAALAGIALLLFLIIRVKLHAFVALLIGSLVIGAGAGMPFQGVLDSVATGVGSTLASIAVVVGLGAMFGQMLEASGGAKALADALLTRYGERNAQWTLLAVGFIVAIPVFFDVAFIILISLVYGLTEKTNRPIAYYALPLLAGLAVTHAFIPPTPGPIAVAGLLGADLGWVMLFGFLIGLPAAIIAGPMYAKFIADRVPAAVPDYMHTGEAKPVRAMPSVSLVIVLITVPLALIVGNTVAGMTIAEGQTLRHVLAFTGHPMVALLITTLLCFWLLGTRCGYSRGEIQEIATKALEPAGIVILVTSAGGALKQTLIDSGVGEVFAEKLMAADMPMIVLAFVTAAVVRLMQGSATVAMLTAAGLVSALLGDQQWPQPMLALLVIAIAAGATIASHVNDSGFWLVNRYLGLSVPETLKTWTVTTTLIAFVSIVLILIASSIVG